MRWSVERVRDGHATSLGAAAQALLAPAWQLIEDRLFWAHQSDGLAIFATALAPYDPYAPDYGASFERPTAAHWFGTDEFGRDVLSRVMYGARIALFVGFAASFAGCSLGATLGVVSAYCGGTVDLSRFVQPGSVQASLLTGMLGVQSHPVTIEVIGWLLYLVPVGCYVAWPPGRDVPARALARGFVPAGVPFSAAIVAQSSASSTEARAADPWLPGLVLLALVLHGAGKKDQALNTLKKSLALAGPEGYLRVFLDEGQALEELLQACNRSAEGSMKAYTDRLLKALRMALEDGDEPLMLLGQARREVDRLLRYAEAQANILSQCIPAMSIQSPRCRCSQSSSSQGWGDHSDDRFQKTPS